MDDDDDAGGDIPEWVVTFGDMMSLLLTFFIMLVSLSEIKQEEQFQAMVQSMQQNFGYDSSRSSVIPGTAKPRNSAVAKLATQGRANKFDIMKGGNKVQAPIGDHQKVRIMRPGERTAIGTVITFAEDSVELSEENQRALQRLALEIQGKPQVVEVRGHTSLRPAEEFTPFADNWELAHNRSRNVAKFLVGDLKIRRKRIRISSAGESEPLHIGTDPIKLRQNPRVEVFLTNEVISDRSGTEEERQNRIFEE